MNRKDSKIQEENIAVREKGLLIVREFDRVIRTFNKVLKYKDECAKSMEAELRELVKSLQEKIWIARMRLTEILKFMTAI